MNLTLAHTPVLIVGAGPSGLMMAAQLLRCGVQPVIIDSKQGPSNESKALAVQARSLEIYRQMGIVDDILKQGKRAAGMVLTRDGAPVAEVAFDDTGQAQTPFPFIDIFQQSKNEKLLLDFLTLHCCPVYWETTLDSFSQSENGVKTILKNSGQSQELACDWLIGADGAHSSVRTQLQIPFGGDTYAHSFYLADVTLYNPELEGDKVRLCLADKGFTGFFPMEELQRYRVLGSLPDALNSPNDLSFDKVLPYIEAACGAKLQPGGLYWFTTYRLHHRMAARFRQQRCFLIGDAAHIHSPVGGQGMNTGLQDAYNLAWKLAGVVKQQLRPAILDSYAAERMPVAEALLKTTDRAFNVIISRRWYVRLFKKLVLPALVRFAWQKKNIREELFKKISQTDINYRDSALNLHISQQTRIKAGDRLPWLKVFDEKRQEETDLHTWCGKPGFTLIVLGKLSETDLFAMARWITQNYASVLNFFYLPPSASNTHVFQAFSIGENQAKSIIVRPDMHIGFINDKVDMVLMDNYLKNVAGVI